jgi:hypothetical protein
MAEEIKVGDWISHGVSSLKGPERNDLAERDAGPVNCMRSLDGS